MWKSLLNLASKVIGNPFGKLSSSPFKIGNPFGKIMSSPFGEFLKNPLGWLFGRNKKPITLPPNVMSDLRNIISAAGLDPDEYLNSVMNPRKFERLVLDEVERRGGELYYNDDSPYGYGIYEYHGFDYRNNLLDPWYAQEWLFSLEVQIDPKYTEYDEAVRQHFTPKHFSREDLEGSSAPWDI